MHDTDTIVENELNVVGIGASAGGLEALQSLISQLKPNGVMTYIIAQHLSPTYKSMMVDLLSKNAEIKITEAEQDMVLEKDTVYVCPPNQMISINSGRIDLKVPDDHYIGPKPNIDILFESIAHEYQSKSVGVILSGTGSDGARGIRMIKSFAGFTYVHDPEDAKYDGMPNAAISTAKIDFILTPEQIGEELNFIVEKSNTGAISVVDASNEKYLNLILEKLLKTTKVDFRLYKRNTILRRIDRRMIALHLTSLKEYALYLSGNNTEVELLYKNILIGVTSFFRDFTAFELIQDYIKDYINKKQEFTFRIWVPGCSTGEEAYTLAIILSEILGNDINKWKIQIFATDIDEEAIDFARKGIYAESALSPLKENQKQKYFTVEDGFFSAKADLRNLCVFSKHDLIKSPPFKNLDLITCRNLLIYFSQQAQSKVFPTFHYSLNSSGFLLLGKSENIGQFQHLFRAKSPRWKIFQVVKSKNQNIQLAINSFEPSFLTDKKTTLKLAGNLGARESFLLKIQQNLIPMCVLINDNDNIIYTGGDNPYLRRPTGEANDNLFQNLHKTLVTECRLAISEANSKQRTVKSAYQKVEIYPGVNKYVRLNVAPMIIEDDSEENNTLKTTLISFQEEDFEDPYFVKANVNQSLSSNETIERLEDELKQNEGKMQVLVEELETSNEELQSLNEELQSANEELQSTNEELETTNEELQSTNEELSTAYTELRQIYDDKQEQSENLEKAVAELEKLNTQFKLAQQYGKVGHFERDMTSNSISWSKQVFDIFEFNEMVHQPTIELIELRIHPDDREIFKAGLIKAEETGIIEIDYRLLMNDGTIKYTKSRGQTLFDKSGKPLLMKGIIQDITEIVVAQQTNMTQEKKIQSVLNNSLAGIYLFNVKTRKVQFVNESYTNITGYTFEDLNNMSAEEFIDLFAPQNKEEMQKHIIEVSNNQENDVFPIRYNFKHKNGKWLELHSNDTIFERDANGNSEVFMGCFVNLGPNYE